MKQPRHSRLKFQASVTHHKQHRTTQSPSLTFPQTASRDALTSVSRVWADRVAVVVVVVVVVGVGARLPRLGIAALAFLAFFHWSAA